MGEDTKLGFGSVIDSWLDVVCTYDDGRVVAMLASRLSSFPMLSHCLRDTSGKPM